MRLLQSVLATLAATRAALASDSGLTFYTFPEDSGVNGTVTIDPAALADMAGVASYTFPEGSGVNGTVAIDLALVREKMGELAAAAARRNGFNGTVSLMAGKPPSKSECAECHKLCIFLCILPPACIG